MNLEAFEPMTLPLGHLAARMALASFVGAAIGFERERRERAAGLRTHMLVSLAAAIFSMLMLEMLAGPAYAREHVEINPVEVLGAVTTGVAFLAAGVIIRTKAEIKGLTTGAGLWLAGALGSAAGAGLASIAILGALFGVFIIVIVRRFEPAIHEDKGKPR